MDSELEMDWVMETEKDWVMETEKDWAKVKEMDLMMDLEKARVKEKG